MSRYIDVECDCVKEVINRRVFNSREDIQDFLDNIPTVDVAPVRHRRWIIFEIWCGDGKERKYYRCSECDKANAIRSNFCPNCGARMNEGDNT